MRPSAASAFGLVLCFALASCSSPPPPPKPKVAKLTLAGAADLNPNLDSQPSPLIVQIVQLRGEVEFTAAPFDTLKRDPTGALGQSLAKTQQRVTVMPGSDKLESFELDPTTTHIGVFGFFSGEPGGEEMRKCIIRSDLAEAGVRLRLSGYTIQMSQ